MSSKAANPLASQGAYPRATRSRWSLGARLTLWYALSAFGLVLAAVSILYWGLVKGLQAEDDQALQERIQVVRALLLDTKGDASQLRWEVQSEWESVEHPQFYIRVSDENGRSLMETPGMSELLPPDIFQRPSAEQSGGAAAAVLSPYGKTFRVLSARVERNSDAAVRFLLVALDFTSDQKVLAQYRRLLMAVLGAAVLLSLGFGYRIAYRGMAPVGEMVAAARRVRTHTLNERIEIQNLPAELAELAENFNAMLGRLEDSFARLSRFSADLAHELRTPLSNLRGEAEVALSQARTAEEYREVLSSNLEEYDALARIIDSLLFIARSESPEAEIRTEPLEIGAELLGLADFYEALASENGVSIVLTSAEKLEMPLDRTLFQRAVGNLLSNAISHTPAGGQVTLSAIADASGVRVEVADTGQGIAPEHIPHLFERFYRVDGMRARASGGAGLGLSIVKTAVAMHGGEVHLSSNPGRGTLVTLSFPNMTKS
jgi:two-component system, OmpR family, heavy metal sensor histidine kinase CusS